MTRARFWLPRPQFPIQYFTGFSPDFRTDPSKVKPERHPGAVWIRLSAAQAIWRVSHNPARSLPPLVALLDSVAAPGPGNRFTDDQQVIRSLEAIAEMGPVAKAALPSIERVRPFSMAARHAANRALAAVQETN